MTKKTRQYYLGMVAVTIICIVIGIIVRNSITGIKNYSNIEKVTDFDEYSLDAGDRKRYFEQDIETFEQLENKSDLIVSVKVDDERIRYNDSTKTTVTIQKVYKGNEEYSEGNSIKIYEPAVLDDEMMYTFADGYQLMNSQEEYILFLKHLDTIEGYQYQRDEKDCFLPVSTLFGKYSITKSKSDLENMKTINYHEEEYKYKDVKVYPIIPTSKKQIQTYKEINTKVLESYTTN